LARVVCCTAFYQELGRFKDLLWGPFLQHVLSLLLRLLLVCACFVSSLFPRVFRRCGFFYLQLLVYPCLYAANGVCGRDHCLEQFRQARPVFIQCILDSFHYWLCVFETYSRQFIGRRITFKMVLQLFNIIKHM
jgi:hypothetical protein